MYAEIEKEWQGLSEMSRFYRSLRKIPLETGDIDRMKHISQMIIDVEMQKMKLLERIS